MYMEMFLRIFSDCCIFFALLGCCPSLLPYSYPLPAAAVILAVSATIAVLFSDKKKRILSLVCLVLPFLSLLLASGWQEMLILILPILYTCSVILRRGVNMEYFQYSAFFKRALVLLAATWAIISAVIYFEDPKDLKEAVIHTEIILQYTVIFFLCGVILQRQLRLGARSQGGVGQVIGMLGCIGAVGASFVLTEPFLRQGSISVLRNITIAIISPFFLLLDLYEYIQEKLAEMRSSKQYIDSIKNSDPSPVSTSGLTPYQERLKELEAMGPQAGHSPWVMLIAAVAAIILLILMVIAFTKLRKRTGASLLVAEAKDPGKKQRLQRMSNRGKVRQAYRDFLRFERCNGLKIKRQYTTADILSRISDGTNKPAASELRDIYLRARYDERFEVKTSHVNAAKDALKRIRKF